MTEHTVRQELHGILAFVGAIWAVFLLSLFLPLDSYGLQPRTLPGLVGIVMMPFLHLNLRHLLGNTVPLLVLLGILAGSRARSWAIVVEIIVLSGVLLWLVGRPATHIGASGLVMGLIVFLILSGLMEQRLVPLLMTLLTLFLYGGTLLSNLLPFSSGGISWEGHWCGAIAGGLSALQLMRRRQSDQETGVGRLEADV